MKLFAILFLVMLVAGCSTNKKIEPVLDSTKVLQIDPKLLEPCPLLGTNLVIKTFEDALIAYSDLGNKYVICALKQNDSIAIIKDLGNIK